MPLGGTNNHGFVVNRRDVVKRRVEVIMGYEAGGVWRVGMKGRKNEKGKGEAGG